MNNNCCKDCQERTPYCHSDCKKFKEFIKWNEKRKKKVKRAEAKYRDRFYK